jgi:cellulose biosynthesis protein BcsQ
VNVYTIWNNKGGVGKSTIAFNLAARYAELHKDKSVLVLDMCPQANVTMTLLGGGSKGEANLLSLQAATQTVVGYIDDRISAISGIAPKVRDYHIQVAQYNPQLPPNLWLIPGDGNLELVAPAISYYANAQMPADAWRAVHDWVKQLIASPGSAV